MFAMIQYLHILAGKDGLFMLAMTDTPIEGYLPIFAGTGVHVAFLVPTPTGFGKSIMDATASVRSLLKEAGVHDYTTQKQGPMNKVLIDSYFVYADHLVCTKTSLYRPVTKQGDPRIWFYALNKYCEPCNLLALIIKDHKIYIFNLSSAEIAGSLSNGGFAFQILAEINSATSAIADELRSKIQALHNRGFIPAITHGDTAVGDTLEHELGIDRNNSKLPDYRGIELKASRITRNGSKKATTRQTLFTKVPDSGKSYRAIVEAYGKMQVPRGSTEPRLQLYETFRVSRPNAYGLRLVVDEKKDELQIVYDGDGASTFVSAWSLNSLREQLAEKHKETFWVKAQSITKDGIEHFRYDKILHTRGPNVSLLPALIEADIVTLDLAAHFKPDGSWRDHGILFKIMPDDLALLVGEPKEYEL